MIRTHQPVEKTVLIMSLMRDKLRKDMMLEFLEFKKIFYYPLTVQRAATLEEVQQWLPEVQSFPVEKDVRKSLLKELESKLVMFAGSFYFYPTVVDWLFNYME